eukprot:SM000023S07710  [mRNA]  locus=s23:983129:990756:- [translate_table: standard]
MAAQAFQNLAPLDVRGDAARRARIPLGPSGLVHGVLPNGLQYYVRRNSKPKLRAAIALGVRVGSLVETEEERGVAHIVEHLAFSATKHYSNHDIVRFLESVGAEFGACQNAYTSADETVFELLVPVDKPGLLSQALSVLAEFSTEVATYRTNLFVSSKIVVHRSRVRAAEEDLEKERGAVLEEWRDRRNAAGRMQEAHWMLMLKGTRYAERQPIGLERVIRGVPASVVRAFYRKWYRPENMAVVAIGDFEDTETVVEMIKDHFSGKTAAASEGPATPIPFFPFVPHTEPRFSTLAEKEAGGSAVMVSFKQPSEEMVTVDDYRRFLSEELFNLAMNQRLFKISRRKEPPFYSCQMSTEALARPVTALLLSAACKDKGTLQALESMLTEVARVRQYGFTDKEVALVRLLYITDMESAYLERSQMPSTSLRDEYMQHFLRREPVPGIEYEAQLAKALLPDILTADVSRLAEKFTLQQSCVIKTVEPKASASEDDMKALVHKVVALEKSGGILPWDEELIPEDIVDKKPVPGTIVSSTEYKQLEAKEIILSNGMRVCYRCTDFLDDQILFSGYAYGGLSEVPEEDFHSCSMGSTIAGEMGIYGFRPSVLSDMLAGKRVEVAAKVGAYMRTFSGDCSPADLETGLQLMYQLFVTTVEPVEEELQVVMQMTEEAIKAQERDPYTAYSNRVRELNYGNSYYFKPITAAQLRRVDPRKACSYFDSCFKDPSVFTVAIVGNINPEAALPLIQQYLGGIPKPIPGVQHYERERLKPLPFKFPDRIMREDVRRHMVEAQCATQLTFPMDLAGPTVMEDLYWTGFLSKLLETKIMQVLRFKHGQVYSVAVSAFLGGSRPSREGSVRGDIAVSFSCDPQSAWKLVDLALEEIERLQEAGPTQEDVKTVLELEQRAYEVGQQENSFWLEKMLRAYQSRQYKGDLDASFQGQENKRSKVIGEAAERTMREALVRLLPKPARSQHTAVALMPLSPLWRRLLSLPPKPGPGLTTESKVGPSLGFAWHSHSCYWCSSHLEGLVACVLDQPQWCEL